MAAKYLTATLVESVRPQPGRQRCFWDRKIGGLGLRVSGAGRKTWVLLYRAIGRTTSRWLTLGTYPPLSLKDAREKARIELVKVQHGHDPATEKREARAADTFAVLANRFLTEYAPNNKRPRSVKEDTRNVNKHLLPTWGSRAAADIKRRDVLALINGIAARTPVHANRVLALVSKIFNYGISQEIVETNPAHGVAKPTKETARSRVLDAAELKKVWAAIEAEPAMWQAIFKILLLTGQRRDEVRGMQWSELDLDSMVWTIPAERAKNRREHTVPLVGEAAAILKALSAQRDDSSAVFLGRFGGSVSSLQRGLRRIIERVNKPEEGTDAKAEQSIRFTIHDLRRTVGTGLGQLGIERTVIKKLLNHNESGDVTAIYDRHRYDAEKRATLQRWDTRLHEIVKGVRQTAKVIPLSA